MSALLFVIAILSVGYGLISLSQATLGVGMIAIGCFVAILARLVQAQNTIVLYLGPRPNNSFKPTPLRGAA